MQNKNPINPLRDALSRWQVFVVLAILVGLVLLRVAMLQYFAKQ